MRQRSPLKTSSFSIPLLLWQLLPENILPCHFALLTEAFASKNILDISPFLRQLLSPKTSSLAVSLFLRQLSPPRTFSLNISPFLRQLSPPRTFSCHFAPPAAAFASENTLSYHIALAAAFTSENIPSFHSARLAAAFASKNILSCHFALLTAAFTSENILSCHFILLAADFASSQYLQRSLLQSPHTMLLPLHRAACCQLSPFPFLKMVPCDSHRLVVSCTRPFQVASHLPFAIPLHTVPFPSHMVPCTFAIPQLSSAFSFAISLHAAAFPQRSVSAVFSHVVACTSFHPLLVSLHTAAFISFCPFTVPRTWFLLVAFTLPCHALSRQTSTPERTCFSQNETLAKSPVPRTVPTDHHT